LGETQLELVQPLAPESPHREFLETKGEGIQHIMVTVDDIEKEIRRLTDKGCTLLLDIRMPGQTGLEVLKQSRSSGSRRSEKNGRCQLLIHR
jgi:CheY-like chemotaxis protein